MYHAELYLRQLSRRYQTFPRRFVRTLCAIAAGIVTVYGLGGCSTQLEVSDKAKIESDQAVSRNGKPSQPIKGIVYYLPILRFEMEATWTLISCRRNLDPLIKLAVQVTERYVPDDAHPYLIDYTKLDAPTKQTKLSISLYKNGTLQSINGSVEDRTSTIITSALEFAGSVAAPSIMTTAPGIQLPPQSQCSAAASNSLIQRGRLTQQIKKLEKKILEASSVETPDHNLLRSLNADLRANKSAFASYLAATSFRQEIFWTPSKLNDSESFRMDSIGQHKLFEIDDADDTATLPLVCLSASLEAPTGIGSPLKDTRTNPENHLMFRMPAHATLKVSAGSVNPGNDNACGEARRVSSKGVRLPQGGVHIALPLENQLFDNNTIVAEFQPNGSLTKFEFSTSAQAEGLVEALAKTAKTLEEVREIGKGEELRELQAETELLKAKAALIQAERELQALLAEQGGDE